MKFHTINHNFIPVKVEGRIVLAKCTCCHPERWGVFISAKSDREFWYHGFSFEEAQKTFNFLVRRQAQQAQVQ